ncbi:hypothetical protein KUCAC02_010478 [Chaenocephalus aceratus]|uniref:Uncharacterized protein n=1 Tax=Chaenocephalus aceratus TaxID=36190 RepID=A0ACB9VZY7_CHAAC|nr:hypothetical protein KUCAC02_010478 [Chaenocephalus aceratus]
MDSVPEAGTSGTAPKRPHLECLIHCTSQDEDSTLVSSKYIGSWKTLLRAAEIRQHAPILDIAKDLPDDVIPPVTYHRKCRSIFTMKKDLDAIITKKENNPTSEVSRKSARQTPHQSRVYKEECIFCEKTNKYLKGLKTREPLTQCTELRADDTIRTAATRKLDNRILAIVSRELMVCSMMPQRNSHTVNYSHLSERNCFSTLLWFH